MIGKIFGKLTVVAESKKRTKSGHKYWKCVCECGNTPEIRSSSLRTGHEKSCGYMKISGLSRSRGRDRSGERFGKLVAIKKSKTNRGAYGYLCVCDCEQKVVIRTGLLISGNTKSCGCAKSLKGRINYKQ